MQPMIIEKLPEVRRLCEKHRVRRLELFGSAADDRFDAATSDIDLLAEFQPMPTIEYADAFFGLQEELQEVFHRPIDLIELAPIDNPYFLEAIQESRILLYESP